jgi:hypothetical protein
LARGRRLHYLVPWVRAALYAYANAANNTYGHSDGYSHSHSYSYSYNVTDTNRHSHSDNHTKWYADGHSYDYTEANADCAAERNTEAASQSAATLERSARCWAAQDRDQNGQPAVNGMLSAKHHS